MSPCRLGVKFAFRPHAAAGNVLSEQLRRLQGQGEPVQHHAPLAGDRWANLVLVPRFTQAHEGAPGLAFNHAISQVRLGGGIIWADTTDGICRFGLLPPGDTGRNVLVIDGTSTALTTLPAPAVDLQGLTIKSAVAIASAQGPAECSFQAQTSGYTDYQLRASALQTGGRRTTEPVLERAISSCLRAAGNDGKQSYTSVSDVDEPFSWDATGRWSGLVTPTPGPEHLPSCAPLSGFHPNGNPPCTRENRRSI